MLRRQQLAGTRLLRACSLLLRQPVAGKMALSRAKLLDVAGTDDRLPEWIREEAEKRGFVVSDAAINRLIRLSQKPAIQYLPPPEDLDVILCHYNPAGWKRTPKLLHEVCQHLVSAGAEPLVLQVVRPPAEPAALPHGVRNVVYESQSVLFHKENLWNLAAGMTTRPKLLFLDGDVVFSRRDIFRAVGDALDSCDVIQPFSSAVWTSQNGGVDLVREPSALALENGEQPLLGRYHPGFAWAMTRRFFGQCRGFYERHPLGGGDAAFVFSMTPGVPRLPKTDSHAFAETQSYKDYRSRMLSLKPRIGHIEGSVYHLWHGTRENRRYEERYAFMPPFVNGEYPMERRDDGLLEWTDQRASEKALAYFLCRMEDG